MVSGIIFKKYRNSVFRSFFPFCFCGIGLLAAGGAAPAATCSFPLSQSYGSACTDLWVSSSGFISNSGAISNSSYDDAIVNQGAISNLTNTATGTVR